MGNAGKEETREQLPAKDATPDRLAAEKPLEERERKVREHELFDDTQKKLLEWGRNRFWGYIIFIAIGLGATGASVIQSMLQSVNKAVIVSEYQQQQASEAMRKAKTQSEDVSQLMVELRASLKEVESLASKERSKLESIESSQTNLGQDLAKFSTRVNSAIEVFDNRLSTFEQRNTALSAQQYTLLTQQTNLETRYASLQATLSSVRQTADPYDKSLTILIKRISDTSEPVPERAAAANALGDRGTNASAALEILRTQWESKTSASTQEDMEFAGALCAAISRIKGHDSFTYFIHYIDQSGSFKGNSLGVLSTLNSISGPWSSEDLGLAASVFKKADQNKKRQILAWLSNVAPQLLDSATKDAAARLIVPAFQDPDGGIARGAADAISRVYSDGTKPPYFVIQAIGNIVDPEVKHIASRFMQSKSQK
jgi:hypothetical protein